MSKQLDSIRFPSRPANDNAGQPAVIPMFTALLARHDLTRTDVLVYGALAAYEQAGHTPRMAEMTPVLGLCMRELSDRFARLQDRGLIIRRGRTSCRATQRYELLGPRLTG